MPSPPPQSTPAPAGHSVSHHVWRWVSAICLVIVVGFGGYRLWRGPEVVTYPVVRGDVVKSVVASGHVETPYRVEIAAQVTGAVADVLVEEGQQVKAGQPLVALDPTELKAIVVQAEGALAQARARLGQLRDLTLPQAQEALKQATATLTDAEAAYRRSSQLNKSGYETLASLDAATKVVDIARTQVRSAELQVFTAGPGGSDYVLAETQVHQAEANLASANARLAYATIRAPRDGILISRTVEKGTVAQPGKVLMVLAPAGDTQLVVQIDEKNLGLLALGQSALAAAVAYPGKTFAAKLSFINPSVDLSRASIEVKLTVQDPPAFLRQDMTISVDIEVAHRSGTLVVPARVVHDPGSAAPYVLVVHEGRARSQPVTLGLRSSDRIEITEGLAEGDLVVPIASGIKAGQRLRAVTP